MLQLLVLSEGHVEDLIEEHLQRLPVVLHRLQPQQKGLKRTSDTRKALGARPEAVSGKGCRVVQADSAHAAIPGEYNIRWWASPWRH